MELMEFNMIKIEDPSHRFSKTVTLEVSGSFYTFVVEGGTRLSLRVPCLSQSRFHVETQMFFQWDVGWPHVGTLKKAQHKDLWLSIASTQTQLLNGWMCECFAWHLWDQWDLILLIATEDKSLEYLILVNPKVLAEFAWKTLWNLPLKFCFDFVDLDDRRIETFHWFTVCRCCMLQEPGVTEVTCPIAAIQDIYSLSEDGSCQAWLGNSLKRLQKCLKVKKCLNILSATENHIFHLNGFGSTLRSCFPPEVVKSLESQAASGGFWRSKIACTRAWKLEA